MLRKFLLVTLLPLLLAVMWLVGYPGNAPVIEAAGTPGALVPMGDQLGDVGQYYSQISPNMKSRTYVYNTDSNSSHTATITIYSDTGATAATLTCTIAANRVLLLLMNDASAGTLTLSGSYSGCSGTTGLHGVYHMKIVESGGGAHLAVATNAWANDDKTVLGSYQAVADWAVSSTYYVPNVLVGRTTGWDTEIVVQNTSGTTNTVTFSWVKDGESTKYSNNTATLANNERRVFLASQLLYAGSGGTLTEKDGWAWMKVAGSGNMAVTSNVFKQGLTDGKYRAEYGSERMMSFEAPLAGTELFVPGFVVNGTASAFRVANASGSTANLTMRLYNSWGTLVDTYSPSLASERAGYYASNVFSNASNGTYTLRISSTQNVTAAAWHSSGGGHTGVTAQRVGDTDGTASYLPFYWSDYFGWTDKWLFTQTSANPTDITGVVYEHSDGSYVDAWIKYSLARYAHDHFTLYGGLTNELYTKLLGNYPLVIGRFENYSTTSDQITSYNGIAKPANTWYVPFAPSPVVEFGWQPDRGSGWNFPSGEYGIAKWYYGRNDDKYKDLNAIGWSASASQCNGVSPIADNGVYHSRYIPAWWGLGDIYLTKSNGEWSGYNSNNRLGAVSNEIPSACAGRPLRVVNEPNNSNETVGGSYVIGAQANMTYPEQVRVAWVFRTWPGVLMGPSFGGADPDWTHIIGTNCGNPATYLQQGIDHARSTCWDGLDYYFENKEIVSGKTYDFDDFFDTIEIHFYARWCDLPNKDSGSNPGALPTAWVNKANTWLNRASLHSLDTNDPLFVSEYGLVHSACTIPGGSSAEQEIADRMITYDALVDIMGQGVRRMWFTDYCTSDPSSCPSIHQPDRLYTNSSGTTLWSPVGPAWRDKLTPR